MKKFFGEFKTFITRGNVLDMAVGVIVGGAFTAIVNAVCNNVLRPLVNWLIALIMGENSLSEIYTFLRRVNDETGAPILEQCIYIDWGMLINAILQFLMIALVLFFIVKTMNGLKANADDVKKKRATREERAEMKAKGLKWHDVNAVKAFREQKAAEKAAADAKAAEEAAAKAAAEKAANPTAEELLKEILVTLKAGEKAGK